MNIGFLLSYPYITIPRQTTVDYFIYLYIWNLEHSSQLLISIPNENHGNSFEGSQNYRKRKRKRKNCQIHHGAITFKDFEHALNVCCLLFCKFILASMPTFSSHAIKTSSIVKSYFGTL